MRFEPTIFGHSIIGKPKFVGNKLKGRISKRLFQENKARQILRSCACAYQGVRNVDFSENLACFVFLKLKETF